MATASNYYIGANDEHGQSPPTAGKRTPYISYLGRSIYENEFNDEAKRYFIEACLRCGFRVYDVKPEVSDITISSRIVRINRQGLSAVVTFAYNAYGTNFGSAEGFEVFYSTYNVNPTESRRLAQNIYEKLKLNTDRIPKGVNVLNTASVLNKVDCLSVLIEAGFMSNQVEARLMLDPDFQRTVGESACQGVCTYYNVQFLARNNLTNYPVIKLGSRNNFVALAQNVLRGYGYNINADSLYGVGTNNAIINFQKRNGLVADGVVGRNTWSALLALNPTSKTLQKGDTNSSVYYLQQKLLSKFYYIPSIDGKFGDSTNKAVKEFQNENGLMPDGIVGPSTWVKLVRLGTGRSV